MDGNVDVNKMKISSKDTYTHSIITMQQAMQAITICRHDRWIKVIIQEMRRMAACASQLQYG